MNYIQALGYINANPNHFLQADKHKGYICPICGSGSGQHGTGLSTKDGKHFTCWSKNCFTNASVTDILAIKAGVTDTSTANFRQVVESAAREVGITIDIDSYSSTGISQQNESPKPIATEYIEHCRSNLSNTDYFAKRGIGSETLARFPIGYDTHFQAGGGNTWQAVIFFTGISSYEARNTDPMADSGNRHRKQGKQQIFNREALQGSEPVFVTESIFDALSIIEAGGEAISAGGTSGINLLLQAIQKYPVNAPRLILTLDNDKAGINTQERAKTALKSLNFPFDVVGKDFFGNAKDANEALCTNGDAFRASVQQVIHDAKAHSVSERATKFAEYTRGNTHNMMAMFDAETEKKQDSYSTGFGKVDRLLDGGFYPGLYIIGAISSLGKTTFCLQMADSNLNS